MVCPQIRGGDEVMPRIPPKIPKTLIVRDRSGKEIPNPTLAQWKAAAYAAGWSRGYNDLMREIDPHGEHFRTCPACGRSDWQDNWDDEKCPQCGAKEE